MTIKNHTLSGRKRDEDMTKPTPYALAILNGLQSMRVYQGTVPAHVVATRRLRNRMARVSRRINRASR